MLVKLIHPTLVSSNLKNKRPFRILRAASYLVCPGIAALFGGLFCWAANLSLPPYFCDLHTITCLAPSLGSWGFLCYAERKKENMDINEGSEFVYLNSNRHLICAAFKHTAPPLRKILEYGENHQKS